jgi:hypothetical protein
LCHIIMLECQADSVRPRPSSKQHNPQGPVKPARHAPTEEALDHLHPRSRSPRTALWC